MSIQFIAVIALAGAAALWFLRGILREFQPEEEPGCASGGGSCGGCPFQAPVHQGSGPLGK